MPLIGEKSSGSGCSARHPRRNQSIPMHKILLFTLGAAILFTGCTTKKSAAWQTVRAVPHAGPGEKVPAAAYANRVHVALRDAGIEHKVVTFKFHYGTRLLLRREGEETAVVYRDPATPANSWWLMAERLSTPVWLPDAPIERQAAFYVSRPVSIVKFEDLPASAGKHDGKRCVSR